MTNLLRNLTAIALFTTACAHHERQVVRLQPGEAVDLQNFDMKKQSLIIELREGEVIPLDISFEGEYLATAPAASVPVAVKKSCYVRVDDRGIRFSVDLQSFDEKPRVPGSFQLGVGMTAEGKRGTLRLRTPTR